MPASLSGFNFYNMKVNSRKLRIKEGEDYYLEGGLMVFTSAYHLKRGFCCQNNCRHCPYRSNEGKFKKTKNR